MSEVVEKVEEAPVVVKNKEDLYNAILRITRTTGQGLVSFIVDKGGWNDFIDDLIEEGHVVKYTYHFTHLPNSIFYCLTSDIYCVEKDDQDGNGFAYDFMRHYMGFDGEKFKGITTQDIVNHNIQKYKEFVNKNLEGLEAIKSLKPISLPGVPISEEIKEAILKKGWIDSDPNLIPQSVTTLFNAYCRFGEIISNNKKNDFY